MKDHILSATGLSKRFGTVDAVKNATFSVRRGGITSFLGENGAGKTTTLKLLLGFLKSDSGRMEMKAQRTGYIPERPAFFGWLTGSEIIAYTARIYGISREKLQHLVSRYSEYLSFDPALLSRKVQTYSLGNQKKFSFLQNLLLSPDFLIVDEPFNSLDPVSIKKIRDFFLEVKREEKSILLCTHLISEAEKICDDFIILKEGSIVLQANLRHFKEKYVLIEGYDSQLEHEDLKAFSFCVKKKNTQFEALVEKNEVENAENFLRRALSARIRSLDLETIFLFFSS